MRFPDFVGHEDAKLALILNAIDPNYGGVLFVGERGSGKSTLSRLFKDVLPEGTPFIELPLNITEDVLLGGIDLEETIQSGRKVFQHGILDRAHSGIIYIDDVNLLSPEIIALILQVQGRGENIIEREGLTLRHTSRFILLASMNPEEGTLSPHLLDHFGMCVLWERLKETFERIEVVKKAAPEVFVCNDKGMGIDGGLKEKVLVCRSILKDITLTDEIRGYIARLCIENYVSGHRGDLFLFYACRAYATFYGYKEVTKKHVDEVLPLVLLHRRRILQQMEKEEHRHDEKKPSEQRSEKHEQNDTKTDRNDENTSVGSMGEGLKDFENRTRESHPREEVFELGDVFKTRRIIFRKDRVNRSASGRRTKTKSKDKGGRYVKSVMKTRNDIAIDATLRAAAPFQKIRGRKEMLLIHDDDLRFKQREKKMGHLAVFVVDGSGSMGAQRRMVETKGAIQSLLMDCYQKRDMVSMIVFRKEKAEVVLPPTSSVENASKRLREIPVGGKTPLAAGLLEAYKLIKRVMFKSPQTRFLVMLITDGRANQSISEEPVGEEMEKISQLLRELRFTDYIVVDTEDKSRFIKTDFAREVASKIGADYYTINNLKTDYLSDIIKSKKTEEFGV